MAESEMQEKPTPEVLVQSLLDISVAAWRLGKLLERVLSKLEPGEKNRYQSQFRWFQKTLEKSLESAQLKIHNVEGQEYDPGMPVTPLNMENFEPNDLLIVDQMIEPIFIGQGHVRKTGTVTLRKGE